MTRKSLVLACALAFATPALADDQKPADMKLTPQDVSDIANSLAVVGSLCNSDHVAYCQAGADAKTVFAKIQAIYATQNPPDKSKK